MQPHRPIVIWLPYFLTVGIWSHLVKTRTKYPVLVSHQPLMGFNHALSLVQLTGPDKVIFNFIHFKSFTLIHFSRFLSSPYGCLFRKISGECRARTCDLLINSQTLPPTELKPHKKYRLMDSSARRLFVFYMQMSYYIPVGFPRHNRPAIKVSGFFSWYKSSASAIKLMWA